MFNFTHVLNASTGEKYYIDKAILENDEVTTLRHRELTFLQSTYNPKTWIRLRSQMFR